MHVHYVDGTPVRSLQIGFFVDRVFSDQSHQSFVIRKLDDGFGVLSGYTVVCVQGVQLGTQNTTLGCSNVEDNSGSLTLLYCSIVYI